MKVSISYISSDKFYGKAYRRAYESIESISRLIEKALITLKLSEPIEIWFVDKPDDYVEIVKSTKSVIEVHVGRDIEFDYRPMSCDDPINKIRFELSSQLIKALGLVVGSEQEVVKIKKIVQNWYSS